jgi:Ca2+-binding RTX toxin-like protein
MLPTISSPARRACRLGAAGLLAGAALATVPAMASATASTCAYNTSNKNLIITDNSGDRGLRVFRVGEQIRFSDEPGTAGVFCPIPGQFATATVLNTERIAIFRSAANLQGGVTIDQYSGGPFRPGATPETDGQSEVEISIIDDSVSGFPFNNTLAVYGTPQYDSILVGTGGRVNLGFDADVDIAPSIKPDKVIVDGREGNDDLWGTGVNGNGTSAPADVALSMQGFDGNDMLVGGAASDDLHGGNGDDRFITVDTVPNPKPDGVFGNEGFDTANVDAHDGAVVEKRIVGFPVGRLKLAPRVQRAQAGEPARLKLSWTHPKAWKQLRRIKINLEHAGETIGTITLNPHSKRTTASGDVKLASRATKLAHDGKTVTADLAIRLPRSLAGENVRVAVEASDRNGKRQTEPLAGHLRLTK